MGSVGGRKGNVLMRMIVMSIGACMSLLLCMYFSVLMFLV